MERRQKDFTWKAKKFFCHIVNNSPDNLYLAVTPDTYRGDSWASHTSPQGLKASLQYPQPPARKNGLGDGETPKSILQLLGESQAVFLPVSSSVCQCPPGIGRKENRLIFFFLH